LARSSAYVPQARDFGGTFGWQSPSALRCRRAKRGAARAIP